MSDPLVAALSLLGASVFVLGLCFGGALIAAESWRPGRRRRRRDRS